MENMVVFGIGATALGYLAYIIWRGINGKTECGCGSGGSCKGAGGNHACCGKSGTLPK